MKYTLGSSAPSYIFHNQHKTLNNLYVDVCTPTLLHEKISLHTAHAVLSAPLFLEQNIKHFVWPDLGPNCLLKISLSQPRGGGGGGGGGGGYGGGGTAYSISAADKRTG